MPQVRRDAFVTFERRHWFGRRWYFHYRADNGEIVFASEGYTSPVTRDRGIAAARRCQDAIVIKRKDAR